MKEIPITAAVQWKQTEGLWSPIALSLFCPYCSQRGIFDAIETKQEVRWEVVTSQMRCPSCRKRVTLWAIGCKGTMEEAQNDKLTGVLAVHPHPEERREPMSGSDKAPERVQRAYQDALDSYNHGIWNPAVVSCRRTLEGIVKDQLPEDQRKGTLYQQLDKLPSHVDLGKPLLELTHAVRESGNLGAHFDSERDTDQEVARSAIELIEFFLEYLYVLPTQVEDLRIKLRQI